MLDINEAQESFNEGKDYFSQNDFYNAEECFKKAALNDKMQISAYFRLIELYIKISNYLKARETLSKITLDSRSSYLNFLIGNIESKEYNFNASLNAYSKALSDTNYQLNNMLHIARAYFNLGKIDMALKIFETLQLETETKIEASFNLINIFILLRDYNYAYKLLQKINITKLNSQDLKRYKPDIIAKYLKFKLGLISTLKDDDRYILKRLIIDDDEELIKHISLHIENADNKAFAYFFKYTNLNSLINDVREKIANMNYTSTEVLNKIYLFPLDSIIGYNNQELTKDLCVITTPEDKIITMYPIYLSKDYNIEGYAQSLELIKYRNERGLK